MCDCDQALEWISAALDGALTPEEQRGLDAHLAACAECRALAKELRQLQKEMPGEAEVPAGFHQAVMDRIAAEQELSDEIARQEAEEVAKQQAAYSPKHLAGTDTAQTGSLAQTGDRAGLIGETFVIGGTVLVAAGIFLDQKKRREQM